MMPERIWVDDWVGGTGTWGFTGGDDRLYIRADLVAGADWAHAQYEEEVERYRRALTTAQRQLMPVRKMLLKTNAQEFKKYGDAINSACNALDVIDNALKVEDEHD